jgi:hypothetical protein
MEFQTTTKFASLLRDADLINREITGSLHHTSNPVAGGPPRTSDLATMDRTRKRKRNPSPKTTLFGENKLQEK